MANNLRFFSAIFHSYSTNYIARPARASYFMFIDHFLVYLLRKQTLHLQMNKITSWGGYHQKTK
jgi:hypothetical protein